MTEENETDRPALSNLFDGLPVTGKGCLGLIGGMVVLALALYYGLPYAANHSDADGDGVIAMDDRCPELAGGVWASDQILHGCPDKDPDNDGFYVQNGGVVDALVDKCPDVAGDADHQGCPPPTPEEVAMAKWKDVEVNCAEASSGNCFNAESKLSALPATEQTAERKAKAHEAEQIFLESQITPDYTGYQVYEIPEVAEKLGRVTNTEHAATLRKQVAQTLWVAYYYDCNPQTQVCYEDGEKEHRMTRDEAAGKIFAFYPSEAFDKPVDLAVEVFKKTEYSELEARAVVAAHENDPAVSEADLAKELGFELKDLTISDCTHEAMYRQALAYGWFRPQAEKCVGMFMEEYKFQQGITFARQLGMEAAAQRIEAEAIKVSLEHGQYSVTDGGQRVIVIADLEDLKGS